MERTSRQERTFVFDLDARTSDDAIPVVVSTDAVVDMPDGKEILVHTAEAIDLQRAPIPIIVTHRDHRNQINVGNIGDLRIVNGQLRGVATFGERPEALEYKTDVLNRTIRGVSAGYIRLKGTVRKDGVLLTTRWMPIHAAMVAEPADVGAGFYRDAAAAPPVFELTVEPPDPPAQAAAPAAAMRSVSQPAATTATQGVATMAESTAAAVAADPPTLPAQPRQGPSAMDLEKARVRAITNQCKACGIDDNIRDHFVGTGLPFDVVSDDILKIVQERAKSNTQEVPSRLGLTDRETQRFSLFKAIQATDQRDWSKAGFELECTREIAKKLKRDNVQPNRFFVPMEVQERAVPMNGGSFATGAYRSQMAAMQMRDLTVGTTTAGGFLVGTKNMSFIEVLRNRTVATRMGATTMPGLVDSVTIPRQTGAATAVWMANEASTITESQQVFAQLALSPKTVGAYTEVSRQLMLQSSPAAEGIVTSDLASVAAIAYDLAVISGSGASGQPTGITNTAGIGSVTGTSLAYAGILEFQTDVAGANVMPASGGYVTTPSVVALLMARVKFTSTASPLWEGNIWDGTMSGFPGMSSLQMAAATMLFGDWAQVVIGEWGTLEIEVNPYANFQSAITGIRAIVSMDCGLRYAGAFSLASSIT